MVVLGVVCLDMLEGEVILDDWYYWSGILVDVLVGWYVDYCLGEFGWYFGVWVVWFDLWFVGGVVV